MDLFDPGWSLDNAVEALLSGHKQEETAPAQPTSRRYTIPVTDVDVAKARVESVPKKPMFLNKLGQCAQEHAEYLEVWCGYIW